MLKMDNNTLTNILLNNEVTHPHYGGVVAFDLLPSFHVDGKKYYIINTEMKHLQHVGHWIILYFHFGNGDF